MVSMYESSGFRYLNLDDNSFELNPSNAIVQEGSPPLPPYPSHEQEYVNMNFNYMYEMNQNNQVIRPTGNDWNLDQLRLNNGTNGFLQSRPIQYEQQPSPPINNGPNHRTPPPTGTTKRVRTAFTSSQLEELERQFQENKYLCRTRRIQIAQNLRLSERQIKVWFQNRRVKNKKKKGKNVSPPSTSPVSPSSSGASISSNGLMPRSENGTRSQPTYGQYIPNQGSYMYPSMMPQTSYPQRAYNPNWGIENQGYGNNSQQSVNSANPSAYVERNFADSYIPIFVENGVFNETAPTSAYNDVLPMSSEPMKEDDNSPPLNFEDTFNFSVDANWIIQQIPSNSPSSNIQEI